jgi:hypothetical protein
MSGKPVEPGDGSAPVMSRRDFTRSVALGAPAVAAGAALDHHLLGHTPPESADHDGGALVTGDAIALHGAGGQVGVLGTADGAGAFGVYGYAARPGSAAIGGGTDTPASYGAHLGVAGPGSVAVHGEAVADHSIAVRGVALGDTSVAVHGAAYGNESAGVLAEASAATDTAHALWAEGRSHVNGPLSHSSAGFKLDHPLRPGTHYLAHSVVESSEMKNIYDGVTTLDADGRAVIELPEWFEALNSDFRYQLTAIGAAAPELHVAAELRGNRFAIAGGRAGLRVSWMVTGIRRDATALADPLRVETAKSDEHTGAFLRPELHAGERSIRPRPAAR